MFFFVALPLTSCSVFSRLPRRQEITLQTCVDYKIIDLGLKIEHED